MEEYSVYGSEEEEEADDPPDAETDEDLTDEERDIHEVLTILLYVNGFGPLFHHTIPSEVGRPECSFA
jgi:hypothetical protein